MAAQLASCGDSSVPVLVRAYFRGMAFAAPSVPARQRGASAAHDDEALLDLVAVARAAVQDQACALLVPERGRGDIGLWATRLESGKVVNPPLRILNNCAIALGVRFEAVIDAERRAWWNRYGGQEFPPDPAEFWHQPGRGTSES